VLRRVAVVAPELTHRYPTFRFDIARGRVAAAEHDLAGRIVDQVAELVAGTRAQVVFSPWALAGTWTTCWSRAVGPLLGYRVVTTRTSPTSSGARPEPAFLAAHRLRRWVCPDDPTLKRPLIEGYRTQVGALFPDGRIPARAEEYYTAG
jgi:hypothetical protein